MAIYYISNTGNDSNSGLTEALPWQTIDKLNASTLAANDQVLFKRGEAFYGSIILKFIGATASVTYGAYGSGANPIIYGFNTVYSWTNLGSNIWESTNAISTLGDCNMVSINGAHTAMGRTPGFYTVDSHVGATQITSASMGSAINWIGAQVVNRLEHWTWRVGTISNHVGNVITYSDGLTTQPQDGWGFFIQNHPDTLTSQNEWYYNPTTKKIRVYSTYEPTSVKVASVERAFSSTNNGARDYVTIEDLTIQGFNEYGINANNTDYLTVQRCAIDKIGFDGIYVYNSRNYTFDLNTITDCNYSAIEAGGTGGNNYEVITRNTIERTNMILGVNRPYSPAAIQSNSDISLIQYNSIDYSGYNGIYSKSQHGEIRNNFINHSLQNRSDGGGIYTAAANTALVIDGNIVLNSLGNIDANASGYIGARGIYLDTGTKYITVSNNICAHNWEGIYISTSGDHDGVTGNLCFDNIVAQVHWNFNGNTTDPGNDGPTELNTQTNNIFVAKSSDQLVASFTSTNDGIPDFLSVASNNVYARPIDDVDTFLVKPTNVSWDYKTLDEWKALSGKDANSRQSPFAVSAESDIRFEYNETSLPKTVVLDQNYRDIATNLDHTIITLAPYTAMVLLKHASAPISKYLTHNGKNLIHNGKYLKY